MPGRAKEVLHSHKGPTSGAEKKNVLKKVLGARVCEACQSWFPVHFLKIISRESCYPRLRMKLCIKDSVSRAHVSAPNAAFIPVPSRKAWPWGPPSCQCHVWGGGQGAQCSGRSLRASEVGMERQAALLLPRSWGPLLTVVWPSSQHPLPSGLCPMHAD